MAKEERPKPQVQEEKLREHAMPSKDRTPPPPPPPAQPTPTPTPTENDK